MKLQGFIGCPAFLFDACLKHCFCSLHLETPCFFHWLSHCCQCTRNKICTSYHELQSFRHCLSCLPSHLLACHCLSLAPQTLWPMYSFNQAHSCFWFFAFAVHSPLNVFLLYYFMLGFSSSLF